MQRCECGAPVWDGRTPTYLELIICDRCGRDNSRVPPLRWRISYALRRARKVRRIYGFGRMLRSFPSLWRLPREIEPHRSFAVRPRVTWSGWDPDREETSDGDPEKARRRIDAIYG